MTPAAFADAGNGRKHVLARPLDVNRSLAQQGEVLLQRDRDFLPFEQHFGLRLLQPLH